MWKFDGQNTFFNIYNDKVLDVQGGRDQEGNNVQVWNRNRSKAQQWKLIYVDKAEKPKNKGFDKDLGLERNRPFYIVSKLTMERVVECWGANNIILSDFTGSLGQQFFFDPVSKTIKSQQWKDRSMTIQGAGRSANLHMTTTNSRWFQMFRYKNNNIVNEKGKVMDVVGGRDTQHNNIQVYQKNNGMGQQFEIVYADEMPPVPKKGELNK